MLQLLSRRPLGLTPRSILRGALATYLRADHGLFQSSDGTTPATAETDPVGYVTDYGGNGNHHTQATAGLRPFLHFDSAGRPCIRFQRATTAYLVIPNTQVLARQNCSVFLIGKYRSDGAQRVIYSAGSDGNVSGFSYEMINGHMAASINNSNRPVGMGFNANQLMLFGMILSGSTFICVQDDDAPVLTPSTVSNVSCVGGRIGAFAVAGDFYANIDLYEVIVASRAASRGETVRLWDYTRRTYWPSDRPSKQVVFVGDSLTVGASGTGTATGAGVDAPVADVVKASLGDTWQVRNEGINAAQIVNSAVDMTALAPTWIDPLFTTRMSKNILVVWAGTNDIAVEGATDTTTYNRLVAYCQARQAVGWKVVVCTILPRSIAGTPVGFEGYRTSVNSSIRTNHATFCDAVADVAGDNRIGDNGDSDDTTYYADKLHLKAAGYAIVAGIVQSAVSGL